MQAMPALFLNDLDPRHERLLALALVVALVVGIGWTLWRHVPALMDREPLQAAAPGPGAPRAGSAEGTRTLDQFALFGGAPEASGMPSAVTITAPESELDLALRGTVAAGPPGDARAIVSDGDGNERAYRVGDELPGGATLERVERERVILRRSGGLEALTLREPGDGGAGSGADRGAGGAGQAAAQARDGDLAGAAKTLREDPTRLARDFTAVPVQQEGRMIGVRLRSAGNTGLLGEVGLRSSDVLTSVNGIPLNDPSRAGEVMRQLQEASEFRVTVLRNGREQQITVSLNQ